MSEPAAAEFRVVAIIAAYNEGDIIAQVVADLIRQGVYVYLLDDGSTDDTVRQVTPYLGRGLLAIEPLSAGAAATPADGSVFAWERILRRKEQLARDLPAAWYIHHDADEFRESPWEGLDLAGGIRRVDGLGYNAIDFEILNFVPTHDRFRPGDDVRASFPCYEPAKPWDRVQVKCWKRTSARVDLRSTGGHEARFPDRRVFPLRFLVRHYPIRGQAHGERKVFEERRPRFPQEERARGWHLQYDAVRPGQRFVRDPAGLARYDAVTVRIDLARRSRDVEAAERAVAEVQARLADAVTERDRLLAALADREQTLGTRIARLEGALDEQVAEADRLRTELRERSDAASALAARLDETLASRSWRWMAPLRAAYRLLGGA